MAIKINRKRKGNFPEPPPISNGRTPWEITNKGDLEKRAHSSRELYRKLMGWSVEVATIEWAEKEGVNRVVIDDLDTKQVYRVELPVLRKKGVLIDWGYGKQLCLPLQYWKVSSK